MDHRGWRRRRVRVVAVSLAVGVGACTPFGVPGGDAGTDAADATEGGAAGAGGSEAGVDVGAVDAHGEGGSSPEGGAPGDGPSIDGDAPKDGNASDGSLDAPACVASATPLRLIAPLSTSFVTSRRPTLTWEGQASCGATIDLCSDSMCTQVVATVAPGPGAMSGRPSADLPTGVVFWRARSGTAVTSMWSFFVGKGTPVDSSGGTFSDFNGDGRSDVAVLADNNVVLVYYGSATGLQTPPTTLSIPSTVAVADISSVGDVSGDGLADLVVALRSSSSDPHIQLYVFLGARAGLNQSPSETLAIDTSMPAGSLSVSPIVQGGLDINRDGFGDFVVLWTDGDPVPVYGGTTTLLQGKAIYLQDSFVGTDAVGVCDLNGDGIQDLAMLVTPLSGVPTVAVYDGTGSTFVRDASVALSHGTDEEAFATLVCADLQGDGYPEIVLGAPFSADRGVSLGDVIAFPNVSGVLSTVGHSLSGQEDFGQAYSGTRLRLIGDMNGDGIDDVAVALGGEAEVAQVAFNGLSSSAMDTVEIGGASDTDGSFGAAFVGDDFDGDGLADLIVSSPTHAGGRLTVFKGSRSARILSPSAIHVDAPSGVTGLGRLISVSR